MNPIVTEVRRGVASMSGASTSDPRRRAGVVLSFSAGVIRDWRTTAHVTLPKTERWSTA
jgi:hypothetical protein